MTTSMTRDAGPRSLIVGIPTVERIPKCGQAQPEVTRDKLPGNDRWCMR